MPDPEARRKTASVAAIGAVIAASAWLRPTPEPPAVPVLPPRSALAVQSPRSEPLFRVPGRSPVQSRFRASSDRGQIGVRVSSDRGQTGVGPGSASEYAATQLRGTNSRQELRTVSARFPLDAIGPPSVAPTGVPRSHDGHVSSAFASAGRHTAGGFKTAARALRSVF